MFWVAVPQLLVVAEAGGAAVAGGVGRVALQYPAVHRLQKQALADASATEWSAALLLYSHEQCSRATQAACSGSGVYGGRSPKSRHSRGVHGQPPAKYLRRWGSSAAERLLQGQLWESAGAEPRGCRPVRSQRAATGKSVWFVAMQPFPSACRDAVDREWVGLAILEVCMSLNQRARCICPSFRFQLKQSKRCDAVILLPTSGNEDV
jgi:hypothetical protein